MSNEGPQMRDILPELHLLAQAHASGPNDDGRVIAQAAEEIARLRVALREFLDMMFEARPDMLARVGAAEGLVIARYVPQDHSDVAGRGVGFRR